jgi:hypothetical protein
MKNNKLSESLPFDDELEQYTIDNYDWELMKESDPNLSEQ